MRRWLPLVPLAAAGWAAAHWWAHVRNEFFVLLGSRNESGGWYGFNSGAAGAFYMSVVPAALVFYYQHTCHDSPWCLRWGKYEAAAGMFRLCRHHHPDLAGKRPHRELIHRMHAEHKRERGDG
jgi:hypothetical protein